VSSSGPAPSTSSRRIGQPRRRSRIGLGAFLGVLVLAVLAFTSDATEPPAQLAAAQTDLPGDGRPVGLEALRHLDRSGTAAVTTTVTADDAEAAAEAAAVPLDPEPTAVFARVGELELRLPSTDPVMAGFHEASTGVAIELLPIGIPVANHNTTKFEVPAADPRGRPYLVMSSRGRVFPATSALDVALRDDDPVLAPVTGVVSDVRTYWLYGAHEDRRVEIVPDDAPHLRIVLVHVSGVQVAAGMRVEAGSSVLARSVNRFPFTSQIDRETEPERFGHVHIELQPVDAPRPGE
jgi:hypothetical protein